MKSIKILKPLLGLKAGVNTNAEDSIAEVLIKNGLAEEVKAESKEEKK